MERSQIIYYDKVYKNQYNYDAVLLICVLTTLFIYTWWSASSDFDSE